MDAFAHGVFPLASRLFNHSCIPSAVPIFTLSLDAALVRMDIQLIRDLKLGEEVRRSTDSHLVVADLYVNLRSQFLT
jgi:hypothetical protein